jgi:divalent metal cation (Fe/Co/Zn/Cd) transporter
VTKAVSNIPHLRDPHDIQVRQVEGKLFITVEVLIDGAIPLIEAHELSTRLQEAIRASVPNVGEALVHLEPRED